MTSRRFAFKWKLLIFTGGLIIGSMGLYLYYILDLFRQDKTAYIYDSVYSSARAFQSDLERTVEPLDDILQTLTNETVDPVTASNALTLAFGAKNIYWISAIEQSGDWKLLVARDIEHDQFGKLFQHLKVQELEDSQALWTRPNTDTRCKILRKNSRMAITCLDIKKTLQSIHLDQTYQLELFVPKIFSNSPLKVEKSSYRGEEVLKATMQLRNLGIAYSISTSLSRAFREANFLLKKSIVVAILVLSLGLICSLIFSRQVTIPLEKLMIATQKYFSGEFDYRVQVGTRDELRDFASLLNGLGEKIVFFLGEMKVKANMESELKVAGLVQESFIPHDSIISERCTIESFYQSAQECGGDWWGHISTNDYTLIAIADATGHGVPAALMTAAFHSCFSLFEHQIQNLQLHAFETDKMMEQMNTAICSSGQRVQMTCLLMSIDHVGNTLYFSNASHNPGFLIPNKGDLSKKDLKSIIGEIGPRLGENSSSEYQRSSVPIMGDERLFVYTDGLIENPNANGKTLGQRPIIKTILEAQPTHLTNKLKNLYLNHLKDHNGDDDVTFATVYLK